MGSTELFQSDNILIHSQLLLVKAGFNINTLSKTLASRPFPPDLASWRPFFFKRRKLKKKKRSEYRNGKYF